MATSSLGKRVFGAALAFGLAIATCAPMATMTAFADDGQAAVVQDANGTAASGSRIDPSILPTAASFAVTTHDLDMTVGEQYPMQDLIDQSSIRVVPPDYKYHFDFLVDASYGDSGAVSVNKHTGELTALQEGTARVGVCLVTGEKPASGSGGQTPGQPDGEVLIVNYVYVQVGAAKDYGFQGDTNAIMMTDPTVSSWAGNMTDGYTNTIETVTPNEDGTYSFTYETTAGFVDHNTPEAYADWNAGNITLLNDEGETVGELNSDNTGALTVAATDNASKKITLTVNPEDIYPASESGQYQLVFHPELRGNNEKRVLGATVTFYFTMNEAAA